VFTHATLITLFYVICNTLQLCWMHDVHAASSEKMRNQSTWSLKWTFVCIYRGVNSASHSILLLRFLCALRSAKPVSGGAVHASSHSFDHGIPHIRVRHVLPAVAKCWQPCTGVPPQDALSELRQDQVWVPPVYLYAGLKLGVSRHKAFLRLQISGE